mmetsp:Transcript_30029/g.62780  ORF Transcript_30029/g.62780 Transcript_30029/m.62780 type:complete len:80 (+) Transcript_30029:2170-2409(+)
MIELVFLFHSLSSEEQGIRYTLQIYSYNDVNHHRLVPRRHSYSNEQEALAFVEIMVCTNSSKSRTLLGEVARYHSEEEG